MEVGIGLPATIPDVRPDQLLEWARRAETRGFFTLGTIDRIVYGNYEPLMALAAAAAVTERIRLATTILIAPYRANGALVAKQAATLDHLSGGRLTLGIGFGWNKEEAADHGVEWPTRRALGSDRLALMRALWADEPTAYDGEFGSVRASDAYPKPVQQPRGPVSGPRTLIGGAAGPKLFAQIAQEADGWLPIGGRGLSESVPKLRTAWEEAGRDPKHLQVVPYAVQPSPGKLAYYADLGVDEVVLQLPPAGETEVLRALDGYAAYL
jgi:probable F420-dependent oxidoreductase